jgi:Site-specific recombinases, DNA invertase Pin homologs
MRKIGYARVSTEEQNLDRQLLAFKEQGCDLVFQEKISGVKDRRPQLEAMLAILTEGDVVIVSEITRFSRSTVDLINIVNDISAKGAQIRSIKDTWLDTTTSQGRFLLTVFAGIAQYERENMIDRINDGIRAAQIKGTHCGRPPMEESHIMNAIAMFRSGATISDIQEKTGVSRATLYRRMKTMIAN